MKDNKRGQQIFLDVLLAVTVLIFLLAFFTGSAEEDSLPNLHPDGEGYLVTQFGDPDAMQELCYTITTDTGLIIIDGGREYEEDLLRKIIKNYDNHVDAWFLTHPHDDHITAFMDIYDDPQGISIDTVYAVDMPDEALIKENAPWDQFETMERFYSMEIPELTYVYTGEEMDILGLHFKILSAYCDTVDEISSDLLNDGSMMFRVSTSENSMLFCADVGKSMTDYLVDLYGDELKSDYVQMGHHGYGGPKKKFYKRVAPSIAFFDAPESLMSGESKTNTLEKVALMESLGAEIYWYDTAPNQVLLR